MRGVSVRMIDLYDQLRAAITATVRDLVSPEPDTVPIEFPPDPGLGDLATPVALSLARTLKRAPRQIAGELAEALGRIPGVVGVDVAGPGFVNIRIDRDGALATLLAEHGVDAPPRAGPDGKLVVEHTNINPNKAAHIGHLRNAVLGDTLVAALRALGQTVEVQNYIDDTGVQVADVVVALTEMESSDVANVAARVEAARARAGSGERGLDHELWDLYARVGRWYEEDEARLEHRARVLHALESGEGPLARAGSLISAEVAACHMRTMARLGIRYDLLPKESDILAHEFWNTAFETLRDAGAIERATSGKASGCWIMRLAHDESADDSEEYEKIIVRSNGTVTYVGKDIAYQLWKFGLLGRDFEYRPFAGFSYPDGTRAWETAPPGAGGGDPPAFGAARRVYNVIDTRQSYLQRVVQQGLERLGHADAARESVHFSYEMVALSPRTALELQPDLELSDDDLARPWLDMSGRKGLGVKADDLLDRLESKARDEVLARDPELGPEQAERLAREISVGALRYYMLRFARTTVVAFDIDAALAFEGETGPYCQYACVRVARIVDKLAASLGTDPESVTREAASARFGALPADVAAEHWALVHAASRLPDAVRQAVDTLELSALARYAFDLAQAINGFYHRHPVLKEPDDDVRTARLAVLLAADRSLRHALALMGVPVPSRM